MATAARTQSVVCFGTFELDLRTRELYKNSRLIKLRGHPIDVLAVLVQNAGELVTREALRNELWPHDTFVDFEQILNNSVVRLRSALGDRAESPKFIETLPRLGYRFIAPVAPATSKQPVQSSGGNCHERSHSLADWKRPAVLIALALPVVIVAAVVTATLRRTSVATRPAVHRIAVLPLTNISADPQQEYFADGMTEQLITELAQIKAWEVISRTSVLQYRAANKPISQIARELSADWIIEGTVQRSGGRVRITAQLIDAGRDAHLWSGSFERDLSDVLALEDEIARAVSAQANLTLTAQENARLGSVRKVDPEAYDDFLTGRYFLERSQFARAAEEFDKATSKDPNFALAYAYFYEADGNLSFFHDLPFSDHAVRAAHRAMELDSNLAESHVAAGDFAFYGQWNWAACDDEFRRGVELDPNSTNATLHYALCLRALGRTDAAFAELQRGLYLDPVSPWLNLHLLLILSDAHRPDEALVQFKKAIEIDPRSALAYACAADLFESLGRDSEAIEAHREADSLFDYSPEELSALDRAASRGGLHRYWQERLNILVQRSKRMRVSPMQFADAYMRVGEKDRALNVLEQSYRQHIPRLVWIKVSRLYEPLRGDPRFQSLLDRMQYPQ